MWISNFIVYTEKYVNVYVHLIIMHLCLFTYAYTSWRMSHITGNTHKTYTSGYPKLCDMFYLLYLLMHALFREDEVGFFWRKIKYNNSKRWPTARNIYGNRLGYIYSSVCETDAHPNLLKDWPIYWLYTFVFVQRWTIFSQIHILKFCII